MALRVFAPPGDLRFACLEGPGAPGMMRVAQMGVGKKRPSQEEWPGVREEGGRREATEADPINLPGLLSPRPDPLSLIRNVDFRARFRFTDKIGLVSIHLSARGQVY